LEEHLLSKNRSTINNKSNFPKIHKKLVIPVFKITAFTNGMITPITGILVMPVPKNIPSTFFILIAKK
jgi:hypothetical protein